MNGSAYVKACRYPSRRKATLTPSVLRSIELLSSVKTSALNFRLGPDYPWPQGTQCQGRRLTSDAQGVDIGLLVPPYLPLHGKTTVTTGHAFVTCFFLEGLHELSKTQYHQFSTDITFGRLCRCSCYITSELEPGHAAAKWEGHATVDTPDPVDKL